MLAVYETPAAYPRPRLLDRVRDAIRARHYSRRTEGRIRRLDQAIHLLSRQAAPGRDGRAGGRTVLSSLAVDGHVAASTKNQALSALLFLHREVLGVELPWLDEVVRARRPERLPVVLTRDEDRAVLGRLDGRRGSWRVCSTAAGLRVLECCGLRVQDVDFAANQIVVRGGKGDKDRVTMLPAMTKPDLARHLEGARAQQHRDLAAGAGWVELPTALARKYPNAGREWAWQWVSPTRCVTRSRRISWRMVTTSGPAGVVGTPRRLHARP